MGHLEKAGKRDVLEVFEHCKSLHSDYHVHNRNKGWTFDKDKSMRHVTSIPVWVLADPELGKYFDNTHSSEDLKKDIDLFLKRTDWFDFRKTDY